MISKTLLLTTLLALPVSQVWAQGYTPFTAPEVWSSSDKLPQHDVFSSMHVDAKNIAHSINNGTGEYKLEYKGPGGSSHQVMVKRNDGKVMGLWSAPNHATYIEGEIFAYTLARLLGRGEWSTHATRMTFTGLGRDEAFEQLSTFKKSRACNRETMIAYMNTNPYYVNGVYKGFRSGEKPSDVPELVDRVHKSRLNPNHFLVKMISRAGAKPTGKDVYLSGESLTYAQQSNSVAKSNDLELAKQLSFMTLVDALNSQRDRFGIYGSNMQVMLRKSESGLGTFNISLIDNGGIATSSKTSSRNYFLGQYGNGVSRFEREIFNRVLEMDDFIQGRKSSFLNFKSVSELKVALGYEDKPNEFVSFNSPASCGQSSHTYLFKSLKTLWDTRWNSFVAGLKDVSTYMRQFSNDNNAFFN